MVADDPSYLELGATILEEAAAADEKPVVVGPAESHERSALAPLAAAVAVHHVDVPGGRPLDPDAMMSMFHTETQRARSEGFERLRVLADMDWLVSAQVSTDAMVAFELGLDRALVGVGATVVCAYRRETFDRTAIAGARCVHPVELGCDDRPMFRIVAGPHGVWRVSGEIDGSVVAHLRAALTTVAAAGPCQIDLADLEFADVSCMRALAEHASTTPTQVVGAPRWFSRAWTLACFDEIAPTLSMD